MRSLGSVGLRQFRRGFGRFVLTASGVMLGVAVLFAVQVANTSASRSVERQVFAFDQSTVSLGSAAQPVPRDVVTGASRLDGVHGVSAFAGFQARFHDRLRHGEPWSVWIAGNDYFKGPAFDKSRQRDYVDQFTIDGASPKSGAFEVTLGDGLARDLGVGVGDRVDVDTPTGRTPLRISMVVHRKDGEHVDYGLATTIETAQKLLGRSTFTSATVELAPGVDVDDWITRHRSAFPRSVLVSNSTPDATGFREFTDAMNGGFAAAALLTVFVGSFLIFLTLSMQVAERTAVYGMFRALGASRVQVARVVLAEALALAVVSTVLGLGLGLLVGVVLMRMVADLYDIESARLVITAGPIVIASVVGVLVTLAGAALPAVRASRMDPVVAMRREVPQSRPNLRIATVATVGLAAGTALAIVRPPLRNDPTLLLVLGSAVLVLPLLVQPLARIVGAITRRLVRGVGSIGVLHLEKEVSRSGYTMGLVMVVLATVLTIGTTKHSFELALDRILDRSLRTDVSAYASNGFDDRAIEKIRGADGVDALTPFREMPTRIVAGDKPTIRARVIAIDTASYFDLLGFDWAEGADVEARRSLSDASRPGVVIGEIDAGHLGLRVGDTVPIDTAKGPTDFPIAGVNAELDGGRHDVYMDARVADATFGAGPASWVRVKADPGVDSRSLATSIEHVLADRTDVTVRQQSEERAYAARFGNQFFSIFVVVVLVALVVGLLGLANTLALTVFRRTRETGILRAIGTERRQLAGMILVESLTLAGGAALVAVPLGALLSALIVKAVSAEIGASVDYAFAWNMVPVVVVTAAVLGALAAWLPARRASRVEIVEALRFS